MKTVEFYTAKELASTLGIPYRLILRALKTGALKAARFGPRHRMIHSRAAAAWIAEITK